MHTYISRYLSVLIFGFIVINSMPAGYCSKKLLYRRSQLFQMEAVFIKKIIIKNNKKICLHQNQPLYLWKHTGFNLNASGAQRLV